MKVGMRRSSGGHKSRLRQIDQELSQRRRAEAVPYLVRTLSQIPRAGPHSEALGRYVSAKIGGGYF